MSEVIKTEGVKQEVKPEVVAAPPAPDGVVLPVPPNLDSVEGYDPAPAGATLATSLPAATAVTDAATTTATTTTTSTGATTASSEKSAYELQKEAKRAALEKAALPEVQGHKLFIGGLSWNTTDESLRSYLDGRFGNVESAVIMRNPGGASRGFGFVIFKTKEALDLMLSQKDMELDGRRIDAKPAVATQAPPAREQKEKRDGGRGRRDDYDRRRTEEDEKYNKIFVG